MFLVMKAMKLRMVKFFVLSAFNGGVSQLCCVELCCKLLVTRTYHEC